MPDLTVTNSFALQTDNVIMARFRKCSGLKYSTEVIESQEVTEDGTLIIRKVPGAAKWEPLVFEAALNETKDLDDWRKEVLDGNIDKARRNGSIIQYDSMHKEIARWDFINGWPSEWSGSDFDATANAVATQTVTVQHEGISRV